MEETYRIVRYFMHQDKVIIKEGVSLEEAEDHCNDPKTASSTCRNTDNLLETKLKGPWFDGFEKE